MGFIASLPRADADPVPSNRKYNWTFTGVPGGIPHRTTICASLGTPGQASTYAQNVTAAQINNAISSCNNGVVYLNAGTYSASTLNGTILLNTSNVTLRGAGANLTILYGSRILSMGDANSIPLGTPITGGGVQGTNTITVASTANLTVGGLIETDRANDPNLVVWTGDASEGEDGRDVTQVNAITAISGNTVTLRNPLMYDFTAGSPAVKFYYSGFTYLSGIENLKFDYGTTGGPVAISECDSCWVKGVESGWAGTYNFINQGTLNLEFRDNYIHDGAPGPDNSGINMYGNYEYGANSNARIENNIFNKVFPSIEINNSSSALYIGYNYVYGSNGGTDTALVTWTFDDGHGPFNIMNLYEGNIGEQMGSDNYYGGTAYGTMLRNYLTGYNPNYGGARGEALWLDRLAYNYNLVGNVLGSTSQAPVGYLGCSEYSSPAVPNIYRLGYPNLGNCGLSAWDGFTPTGGYPDPKVTSTLLRWGNYDYLHNSTSFNASEIPSGVAVPSSQVIPPSYVYTNTPPWWPNGIQWPPIGPDVTNGNGDSSGHVNMTPAQVCWNSLNLLSASVSDINIFNASACYPDDAIGQPSVISVSPNAGSAASQVFTAVYSDPNGAAALASVRMLFNTAVSAANACYVAYFPSSNALYLISGGGTQFSAPVVPGSSTTASNSQCTLSGIGSSYSASGQTATLAVALTFAQTQPENIYLLDIDKNGSSSGWVQKGTWGSSLGLPVSVSVSPNSGTGTSQIFSAEYSDPNGVADLATVRILINSKLSGTNSCEVVYNRVANVLYFADDAGQLLLTSPVTPGSNSQVSNSQCTLSGAGSSYTASGNTATLNVSLTFKGSNTQNIYLEATENNGSSSGWTKQGTWTP